MGKAVQGQPTQAAAVTVAATAEQIQRELPFMDFAGARELAVDQHMFKSYQEQVQVSSHGQRDTTLTTPWWSCASLPWTDLL